MKEEDALRATELYSVLSNHITSESAKFIIGIRPMKEIDDFFKELKTMKIEELIALYEKAYSSYMETNFNIL